MILFKINSKLQKNECELIESVLIMDINEFLTRDGKIESRFKAIDLQSKELA